MMNSKEPRRFKQRPRVPVYAAIDVGSHNVRMALYAIEEGTAHATHPHKIKALNDTHECNLGKGIKTDNPMLNREYLANAIDAVSSFRRVLEEHNIKPENTCAVMTAAIRAVSGTERGQEDIAQLAQAFGGRPMYILTGEEEAILDGEAINIAAKSLRDFDGKRCSAAFAAIGGGSIQLGVLSSWGQIENPVSLPYGVYPLMEESGGDIERAGKILNGILLDHYPIDRHKVLVALGRNWRAVGDAACDKGSQILEGDDIRKKLIQMTHRERDYFVAKGGRVEKCADTLPLAAAMLRRVAKHFDSKKLLFLDATIRDAIAHQMHAYRMDNAKKKSPGLGRLFSHLTP